MPVQNIQQQRKRIGVVSIRRDPDPSTKPFDHLYQAIGRNTGNLMFTEAVYRLIDADLEQIGFDFDPATVNKNFDAVVVPAANWLRANQEWDWLTDRLDQLKMPVTVIGLGVQANEMDVSAVRVSPSARRLAEFFSKSAPLMSVRGNFTRDWLNSIGIKNVVVTGCPSLYMNIFEQRPVPSDGKIVFQSTRYEISEAFLSRKSINRKIFWFASSFDSPMIYQSEPEEMMLLTSGVSAATLPEKKQELLMQLYGCTSVAELDDFLRRNGRVFFNLMEWSDFVQKHRAVFGTRLHGSIVALNSGRPAILVPHDTRTAEVASFAGIQTLHGPSVLACERYDEIDDLFARSNLQRYRDIRAKNQQIFIKFLQENDLKPNFKAMF